MESGTMQTRPYPEKAGLRIWLSRDEQHELLEAVEDDPRHRISLQLGLHGLRTDEIVGVTPRNVRELERGDGSSLIVTDGKTGKRELPISDDLAQRIHYLYQADRELGIDDQVIDVSKRTIRNWIDGARGAIERDDATALGMHDLRRTWATDSYYSLAFAGVPIAEQLVMSWGGWKQSETGRSTFRENYLGPVPDHIVAEAAEDLDLP